MLLKNKVAIVTGGGTGIGKAIALALSREGAVTVIAARTLQRLDSAAEEIRSAGGQAVAVQTDITDEKQVARMVEAALKEYGQIDILVNNSGIPGPTRSVVDMSLEEWNEVLTVNLTGTMLCCREVLKAMIPRKKGNIVNVGSRAGDAGYPKRSPYCASKWGLVGLTETLAIEVGEYNIRVNCVSPAGVKGERTDRIMQARAEASGLSLDMVTQQANSKYALKRVAEPEEVAAAVVFLASDLSSAITGHNLAVNCGIHLPF